MPVKFGWIGVLRWGRQPEAQPMPDPIPSEIDFLSTTVSLWLHSTGWRRVT